MFAVYSQLNVLQCKHALLKKSWLFHSLLDDDDIDPVFIDLDQFFLENESSAQTENDIQSIATITESTPAESYECMSFILI